MALRSVPGRQHARLVSGHKNTNLYAFYFYAGKIRVKQPEQASAAFLSICTLGLKGIKEGLRIFAPCLVCHEEN
jgi:hypothetical protein